MVPSAPPRAQLETLQRMVEAGMTGIRMNLSHGPLSAHKDWLDIIHAVGIPQLLIDLQGPELRIGTLPQPLVLEPGQSLRLGQGGVPCPAALVHAAQPGQNLLLDDGRLLVQVAEADGAALQCTVVRGGTLQSRKSLAAPGLTVASPTLTEEDLQNLQLAGACGVTGVMLPFVRGAEDIRTLRRALKQAGAGQIRIFAKIESLAGVQALPEFLPLVDEVVIARGDLGNAMPLWELPRCQKQLSAVCRSAGCPLWSGNCRKLSGVGIETPRRGVYGCRPPRSGNGLPGGGRIGKPPDGPRLPPRMEAGRMPGGGRGLLPGDGTGIRRVLVAENSDFPGSGDGRPV